jgi:hypothetical protein
MWIALWVVLALFVLLIGLILGGLLGFLAPRPHTAENGPSSPDPAPGREEAAAPEEGGDDPSPSGLRALRQENRRLTRQVESLTQALEAQSRAAPVVPPQLQALREVPPFNPDLTLNEEFASLLDLSQAEYENINAALAAAKRDLEALREAVMTIRQKADTQVRVTVPPFPEEGEALRQALNQALQAELGPVRFATFISVAENAMLERFVYFGAARQTIYFDVDTEETAGSRIHIYDSLHLPAEDDGSRTIQLIKGYFDQLPERYRRYIDWEPAPAPPPEPEAYLPE